MDDSDPVEEEDVSTFVRDQQQSIFEVQLSN